MTQPSPLRERHPETTISSRLIQPSGAASAGGASVSIPIHSSGTPLAYVEWQVLSTSAIRPLGDDTPAAVFAMLECGDIPVVAQHPLLVRCHRDEETVYGRFMHFHAVGPAGFSYSFSVAITRGGVVWFSGFPVPPQATPIQLGLDDSLFLECASVRPDPVEIERLLLRGANPNARGILPTSPDDEGSCLTALLSRPDGSDFPESTARILSAGGDPNAPTSRSNRTPVLFAIACDKVDSLRVLLDAGADPNVLPWNPEFPSPMSLALRLGGTLQRRYLEILSAAGARVDLIDCLGQTPLHFAILRQDLSALRALLLLGVRRSLDDPSDASGLTPLQSAIADWGNIDAVRVLLAHGARPDGQNRDGHTALHTAALSANGPAASLLVRAGCSRVLRSAQGETAAEVYRRVHGTIPQPWCDILNEGSSN